MPIPRYVLRLRTGIGRLMVRKAYRTMVLAVVNGAHDSQCGKDIAALSGLTYRQTIDALNALHNLGKVRRTGRKFTARWSRLPLSTTHSAHALEQAFRGFFK